MSNENEREELRALAAEATPGPWSVFTDHSVRSWHPDDWMTVAYPDGRTSAGAGTNARYIAAASPDRITALLDELDAAERDRDAWKRTADERSTVAALDRAERAEAQAAAVRALHRHVGSWCEECWTSYGVPVAWPCPTIAALDTPADTPTPIAAILAACDDADRHGLTDTDGGRWVRVADVRATLGAGAPPEPDADEREALIWECGPHTNVWNGHDARCRQVRRTQGGEDR